MNVKPILNIIKISDSPILWEMSIMDYEAVFCIECKTILDQCLCICPYCGEHKSNCLCNADVIDDVRIPSTKHASKLKMSNTYLDSARHDDWWRLEKWQVGRRNFP